VNARDKRWDGSGLKARARHARRIRRELEAWPRGGAGGFEPLSDVIARIKSRVDQAIADRDEEAGAEAHADLIDAEHELRVRETVRRCARG
jgi:hypothetical protein